MKVRHIFLLIASAGVLALAGCLKGENNEVGPTGATGPIGANGGNFPVYHNPGGTVIQTSNFIATNTPGVYNYTWVFGPYNPKLTYMVTAYVTKVNNPGLAIQWYKLPAFNTWQTPDALTASVSRDTVILSYISSAQWPVDSAMECSIIVIPGQ